MFCTTKRLIAAILLAYVASPVLAEDDSGIDVNTVMQEWVKAKKAADPILIREHLSPDFLGVGPVGQALDRTSFVKLLSDRSLSIEQIDSAAQSVRVHGLFCVITGTYEIKGKANGQDISGRYRYIDVVKRITNRWQVVASTLTKVTEDSATQPAAPTQAR